MSDSQVRQSKWWHLVTQGVEQGVETDGLRQEWEEQYIKTPVARRTEAHTM